LVGLRVEREVGMMLHVVEGEVLLELSEMGVRGEGEERLRSDRPRRKGNAVGERAVSIQEIIGSSHIKFLLKNIIGRK
jgi:hypothetical protein